MVKTISYWKSKRVIYCVTCHNLAKLKKWRAAQNLPGRDCKSVYMFFFYKHGVFQYEARKCLSFSQIQPQNMLKICFSKNTQKSKFHYLTHVQGKTVGRGYQNEENFEICTFQIANITDLGRPLGQSISFHS